MLLKFSTRKRSIMTPSGSGSRARPAFYNTILNLLVHSVANNRDSSFLKGPLSREKPDHHIGPRDLQKLLGGFAGSEPGGFAGSEPFSGFRDARKPGVGSSSL